MQRSRKAGAADWLNSASAFDKPKLLCLLIHHMIITSERRKKKKLALIDSLGVMALRFPSWEKPQNTPQVHRGNDRTTEIAHINKYM